VPQATQERHPEVEWKKMAGLRDIVIHEYFGIDQEIVWDIVLHHVPRLLGQVRRILAVEDAERTEGRLR